MSNPNAFDGAGLEPAPSKITRFREDRRLNIIAGLRSLSLAGILLTVVFCIFHYQEDLNIQNLRRIVSYIDQLTFSASETDTFTFDAGLSTAYEAFDVGVATCSGGSFRFIPPFENMGFSKQIKYADPHMRVSGGSVFVYDLGGRGISRFNSYSRLAETTMDCRILSFSSNSAGQCAVVTDEEGYRTALTVLDKHLKEIYKWQTSEHFAFLSALSPNGRTAAVLCVGQKEGAADFYIRYQPVNGDDCTVTIDLGDRKVYSMEYADNDRLILLCEDGVYAYDDDGALKGSFDFSSGSLIAFDHRPEGSCAFTLKGDRGDSSRVVVLDGKCAARFDATCEGDVRLLACGSGQLAWLSGKTLFTAALSEGEIKSTELSGVRDVLITETGRVAAVFGDCARIIDLGEAQEGA